MSELEPYKPGLARNKRLLDQLKEFQQNPRSLVFVALAESYRAENLPHQALEILAEGLQYHPDLPGPLVARSRCLFDLRRYADALKATQYTVARNPQNLKAHKLQADIYLRLGQKRAAMRALTHVVSLYPQDVEAVRALEELENAFSSQRVPVERLSRASTDQAPEPGRIEDFQIGPVGETFASIPAPEEPPKASIPASPQLAVAAAEPEAADASEEPTFATRTIAELYLRQGLKPKAIRVLRKILREDPANEWARETLQDLGSDEIVLTAKTPAPDPKLALSKRARALELLLGRVRLRKGLGRLNPI